MKLAKTAWTTELKHLLLYTGIFAIPASIMLGQLWLGVLVGILTYNLQLIWKIKKIDIWLKNPKIQVPETSGGLGQILDRTYQIQRSGDKARSTLQAIIDRSRQSIDALQDGVLLIDHHGRLEWCNKAARRMLGLKFPSDISNPIADLIRDPAFKDYYAQKHYDEPLVIQFPDYRTTVQMEFTLFGQDDRLIIVRDISHLRHLEQMRSDFVANVSHELKTPLTVLRGYLETLFDQMEQFDAYWHGPIKSMEEQALRMDALIDDLLLLSRLESSPAPQEGDHVNLAELAQSVQSEALLLAKPKRQEIELHLNSNYGLLGAYHEIRSAISNLLINAVKYTPEGGRIKLGAHFECADIQDSDLLIWVEDDGLGIEKKHIARLTERFYRVEQSRSTQTGGTGLGLAIVKHVLLRHQGHLDIHSKPGQGSRFTCHFPASRVMCQLQQPVPTTTKSAARRKSTLKD